MAYEVKILADSITVAGDRLTTFELTYPRFVHAEFMTHRVFSRNSASSRAIPIKKMIDRVTEDPVLPVWWGKNQPGMQADEELDEKTKGLAQITWLQARDQMIDAVDYLMLLGTHKQIANRLLEPWMWITVICTATTYGNFFNLRTDRQAQPEVRRLAQMMCKVYSEHIPRIKLPGEWHLPLIQEDELKGATEEIVPHFQDHDLRHISVARCARVSYLTHSGIRDLKEDESLFTRLWDSGHWSPFEHTAQAYADHIRSGNFVGWEQFRKYFPEENREIFDYDAWLAENPHT